MTRLWQRVHPERVEAIDGELAEVRREVLAAREIGDVHAEQGLTADWARKLQRLLASGEGSDPGLKGELRRVLDEELSPLLPPVAQARITQIKMTATASGHGRVYQAGRDQLITEDNEHGEGDGPTRGRPTEERRTRDAPITVTEDGVAPETIAEPLLEQRYLQGRFPERVRLGEVVSLLVRLGLSANDALSSRLKPFSVSSQGTDITLALLESPGFRPRSQRAAIQVFPGRDSDWTLFDLEAVTEGVHTLRVLAFAGGTALGELTVQATVDSGVATSAMSEHTAPAGGEPRDPGEVSLLIPYDRDRAVYRYQLIDWSGDVPEEATSEPAPADALPGGGVPRAAAQRAGPGSGGLGCRDHAGLAEGPGYRAVARLHPRGPAERVLGQTGPDHPG